jgi:hypothetical protein
LAGAAKVLNVGGDYYKTPARVSFVNKNDSPLASFGGTRKKTKYLYKSSLQEKHGILPLPGRVTDLLRITLPNTHRHYFHVGVEEGEPHQIHVPGLH